MDLLAAARRLGPTRGVRGVIFEVLFGLIACTGLRIGEALSLRHMDVDVKSAILTIHQAKASRAKCPCTRAPEHGTSAAPLP